MSYTCIQLSSLSLCVTGNRKYTTCTGCMAKDPLFSRIKFDEWYRFEFEEWCCVKEDLFVVIGLGLWVSVAAFKNELICFLWQGRLYFVPWWWCGMKQQSACNQGQASRPVCFRKCERDFPAWLPDHHYSCLITASYVWLDQGEPLLNHFQNWLCLSWSAGVPISRCGLLHGLCW